jgi:hypothetical protein
MNHARVVSVGALLAVLVPHLASAQEPPTSPPSPPFPPPPAQASSTSGALVEFSSLRLMRDKGLITQAEYDSAMADLAPSTGARAQEATSLVVGRWSTTLYGFAEADFIHDSTQSFNDLAGNAQVQRPGGHPPPPPAAQTTYAGDNGRTTFSVRNSRFGLRIRAPETSGIRVSGMLEMDLLGTQLPIGTGNPYNGSENSFFTSPTLRVRHAMMRVETPVIDVLAGQYWHLFGWQSVYHPNTVEIQGVPGQLYSRTPQLRLSKTLHWDVGTLEIAAAAMRPPARDSEVPELEGGLRFALAKWTGVTTNGATGTSVMPASIAVTGDARHITLPEFSPLPKQSVSKDMSAIAVDAFVPVLPASDEKEGNALSLNAEAATGYGIADLYTGLTGGMGFPTVPNTTGLNPAPTYPQDIDNGIVVYDLQGNLHAIQWTSLLVGLQYYLPGVGGRLWISANYSRMQSANTLNYARLTALTNPQQSYYVSAAQVRSSEDWFDVNLFAQPVPALRVGLEYARFYDSYVDGVLAINDRVQLSGFLLF